MRSLTHDRNASGRSPLLALGSYAPLISDACPPLGCDRAGRQGFQDFAPPPPGRPALTNIRSLPSDRPRTPSEHSKSPLPVTPQTLWKARIGAILVGDIDFHDDQATSACRLPAMYLAVELIEGRRILLVRLHRDTASDGNPTIRCQQAVSMLLHTPNHVRRRWATHRNKKPGCNRRGHGNPVNNLHGSPQVIEPSRIGDTPKN
jgi:hypothetical protein